MAGSGRKEEEIAADAAIAWSLVPLPTLAIDIFFFFVGGLSTLFHVAPVFGCGGSGFYFIVRLRVRAPSLYVYHLAASNCFFTRYAFGANASTHVPPLLQIGVMHCTAFF